MKKILLLSSMLLCLQSQGYTAGKRFAEISDSVVRGLFATVRYNANSVTPVVTRSSVTYRSYGNWRHIIKPQIPTTLHYRGLATWMPDLNKHLSDLPETVTLSEGAMEAYNFINNHNIDAQQIIKEAKENCANDLSVINDRINDPVLNPIFNYCLTLFRSVYDGDTINKHIPRKRLDEISRDIDYAFQDHEEQINQINLPDHPEIPSAKVTVMKLIAATQKW